MSTMKRCKKCGEEKPADQFNKWHGKSATPDGLWPWCKNCRSKAQKEYQDRPEVQARRQQDRRVSLMRRYGLTPEAYDQILHRQGGRCAICRTTPSSDRNLDIDHDHSCCPSVKTCGNCIRGLVCARCNILLGYAKDDPKVLRKAARYLEATKSSRASS